MFEVLWQTPTGRALQNRLAQEHLVAPELLDAEVAAAMRRRLLRGDTTRTAIENALMVLEDWPIRRLAHSELLRPSMRWWSNVSAYDALYLAAARVYEAVVITVDGALARAPVTDVIIENVRVGL